MRRSILIAASAALAVAALSVAAGPRPVAAARAAGPPQLHAVARPDGTVHATWTVPPGTKMEEFLYDTSDHLANIGRFANPGDAGCGLDNWCWPERGTPLYCYFVLYHDRTGDCPGHADLGDKQTSIDIGPLKKGTYYLQVTSMDQCVGETGPCPSPDEYWSNVFTISVNPTKGGGGSSGGSSSGGAGSIGATTSGTARVAFTKTVKISRPGGAAVYTKSTVLLPGDIVSSLGSPTHISVAGGALVLDRNSTLTFKGDDPAAVWQLRHGAAYYQGTSGRKIRNLIEAGYTDTWVCCGAAAVVSVGPAGDTIAVVSPGSGAPASGPVLVMAKRSSNVGTPLAAGQAITVRGTTAAAFPVPKRFVPTRFFWK